MPLALAEADMLSDFITDAYSGPLLRAAERALPVRIGEKIRSRYEPGLSDDRITCLWGTTMVEHARHWLGLPPWKTFAKLDRVFSLAAAARARRARCHLFLYSPYAWEAFTARYSHEPLKVLFQYHPHPDLERNILREDSAKYPIFHHSYENEVGDHVSEELKQRNRDCWRHADLILCASAFTRRSVIGAGADPDACKIVPYGIDLPDEKAQPEVSSSFHALFVGSGTQRKGLHHLLLAWQMAVVPANSRLTLVCRFIDPGLEALVQRTPNTRLLRGVTVNHLEELFRTCSLFVMPSLVEGFGQVYLEALAQGCPVLGSPNTGLPDLDDSSGAIFQVETGQVDQLISHFEMLSRTLPGDASVRKRARKCATQWPWARFREGIRSALQVS